MTLLGNYSVVNKNAGRLLTGTNTAGASGAFNSGNKPKNGALINFALQDGTSAALKLVGFPWGYGGRGWKLPISTGAIGALSVITITSIGSGAKGRNLIALGTITISGTGAGYRIVDIVGGSSTIQVSASGSTIGVGWCVGDTTFSLSAEADILAIGYIVGDSTILVAGDGSGGLSITTEGSAEISISAIVDMYATGVLSGDSSFTVYGDGTGISIATAAGSASLTISADVITHAAGWLVGNGLLEVTGAIIPYAIGWMVGTTEEQGLSVPGIVNAVWGALAESYTQENTMGKKLNDAGGANSPEDIADAVWTYERS
jgi:hypothetical protein